MHGTAVRPDVGFQKGDDEPAAVAFGIRDEGLACVVGDAGLAADRALVVVEQHDGRAFATCTTTPQATWTPASNDEGRLHLSMETAFV